LVIVSLPWRRPTSGSTAVPLMHALRSGGCAASTRVELAPPWDPPTAQGSSDPRRPGSSAAPWLTGDTPTTTQLLPTSCLRICGCQRPGRGHDEPRSGDSCPQGVERRAAAIRPGG